MATDQRKFVAYYRVSTVKQGQSGLGLDAQRAAVKAHLRETGGVLIDEYQEVETGKGANALDKRPQLKAALAACKCQKASLLIAKLDRLARNVHFISGLIETGIDFVAVDMPQANKVMLQMHAVMSEWERDQISARTKAALAAAKTRGVVLGKAGARNLRPNIEERIRRADDFARRIGPILEDLARRGHSQRAMVSELNYLGIQTATGKQWSLNQLQRTAMRYQQCIEILTTMSKPGDI
jgi:DNA invertase Pin-like site-specific DNA recombinase